MELLRMVMLNVIAIVFLTTLLDLLLPEGSMRGYLKMALGFFVVLTLLQPVQQIFRPDGMLQQWQLTFSDVYPETVPVQGSLYEEQQQNIHAAYQQKLEEQVKALLLLSSDMEIFEVCCTVEDYVLQQITITAFSESDSSSERIVQALSSYYGLEPAQICIENREAECNALE